MYVINLFKAIKLINGLKIFFLNYYIIKLF